MIRCNDVREHLALQSASEEPAVQEHLTQCGACAGYQRQHRALDVLLRVELRWEAPAALTARLLALAAPPRPRPKRWYVLLVYLLTLTAIGISLAVAWQFFGLLAAQFGFADALTTLLAAPSQGLAQLVQVLPESRFAIGFFLRVREQLMWLLLAAVLWAILDKWNPRLNLIGRRVSS